MASILHITSQLNTERTYLDPTAVFHKIVRSEPVPLGEPGEQKWAVPHAITVVEQADDPKDHHQAPVGPLTRASIDPPNSPAKVAARLDLYP